MSRLEDLLNPDQTQTQSQTQAQHSQSHSPPATTTTTTTQVQKQATRTMNPLDALANIASQSPPLPELVSPSARVANGHATNGIDSILQADQARETSNGGFDIPSTFAPAASPFTPSHTFMKEESTHPLSRSIEADRPEIRVKAENDSEQPLTTGTPNARLPSIPLASSRPLTPRQSSIKAETPVASRHSSTPGADTQPVTTTKKKPAAKKAPAPRKPAAKKRKLETPAKDGTPFSARSGTPASQAGLARAHKASPAVQSKTGASVQGDEYDEEEDDDEDDGQLFCICRKPDDHSWMIACDGGCEDWFHGRCVKMSEKDETLVDKYICPNCEEAGAGVTTWKPMCRLDGCRQPARVKGPKPSKYCSDAHGEQFMANLFEKRGLAKLQPTTGRSKSQGQKRKLSEEASENAQAHLQGGVLSAAQLKAVVGGANDIDEFKQFGETIQTTSSTVPNGKKESTPQNDTKPAMNDPEFNNLKRKREEVEKRQELLQQKEGFLDLIKNRAQKVLDQMKAADKSIKDICGYDSRLIWTDEEFAEWSKTTEGQTAFESGVLPPPKSTGPEESEESNETDQVSKGVCIKKKCEKHKAWWKSQQRDLAFERNLCDEEIQRIDAGIKSAEERAVLRSLSKIESRGHAEFVQPFTSAPDVVDGGQHGLLETQDVRFGEIPVAQPSISVP